jgi:anti-sigma factor RsiW
MKTHQSMQASLPLAAAGELSREEQFLVEEHLKRCPDCTSEFARLQQVITELRFLPDPRLPGHLLERTLRRVEQQTANSKERRAENILLTGVVAMGWLSNVAVWLFSGYTLGNDYTSWWLRLAASMVLSWSTAGVAAVLLSCQRRIERRSYVLAS